MFNTRLIVNLVLLCKPILVAYETYYVFRYLFSTITHPVNVGMRSFWIILLAASQQGIWLNKKLSNIYLADITSLPW